MRVLVCLALVCAQIASSLSSGGSAGASRPACPQSQHPGTAHGNPNLHRHLCGLERAGSVVVSPDGGLGQIAVHGDLAAIVQRDDGAVALVDFSKATRPKVVGRYEDDAQRSLDGDVAFSADGRWVFYARQTEQFSLDGLHVLDVSDPSAPRLAFYQPQGGAYRVAPYANEDGEWVFSLDAIGGLVVNRFEPTTGVLVPVYADPQPVLRRVGGPASAGIFIDRDDAKTGAPLLYTTSGTSGLAVYDISVPAAPELLGKWEEQGVAAVDVVATKKRRTVYVASEYWFDETTRPQIVELDATRLDAVRARRRFSGGPADDLWRYQGIDMSRGTLYAAHSHAGLEAWRLGRMPRLHGIYSVGSSVHDGARYQAAPYAMDVEVERELVLLTDAAAGSLSILCRTRC